MRPFGRTMPQLGGTAEAPSLPTTPDEATTAVPRIDIGTDNHSGTMQPGRGTNTATIAPATITTCQNVIPGTQARTMGQNIMPGTHGISTEQDATDALISCETFNCHGFKQSSQYVLDRLLISDILCLTETWLRPEENNLINLTISNDTRFGADVKYSIFNKSSMAQVDHCYRGRPFGGLAIIVKKNPKYHARELCIDCDRILCVGIYDMLNNLVQIIVCVYMPFYDTADSVKTDVFVEVLDNIQSVIDKHQAAVPIKILGDFNVQLPRSKTLHDKWYREKGFSPHSSIMYDFICANDLLVTDMLYEQDINYTFFCHSRQAYTWIDHVLSTKSDLDCISQCKIITEDPCNVSDHLPVRLEFKVRICENTKAGPQNVKRQFHVPPNWSSHTRNSKYCDILADKLYKLGDCLSDTNLRAFDVESIVNERLSDINEAIHSAAREAGCVPNKIHSPKSFWCPELTRLRDKKRFWWHLWVSAGRPRNGHVYVIYKSLKKEFRRICRHNAANKVARQMKIINNHFTNRNMRAFWGRLRQLQRGDVSSGLHPNDLASYYKTVMSDNGINRNDLEHAKIEQFVKDKVYELNTGHDSNITHVNTEEVYLRIKKLNKGVSAGNDGITAEHLYYGLSTALCTSLANIYSIIISKSIVPQVLQMGVIIPILKKPSLDPNVAANYRPVTISSAHSKLIELIVIPDTEISDTQFGFRDKRGTGFVTALVNDTAAYFNERGSPVYISSLDAEKCFDTIWHDGLFYKLWGLLPSDHWYFLYKWYKSTFAVVSWNGTISQPFHITKGMKQGSVLSPTLFNIFINNLLESLDNAPEGVMVFGHKFNSCAYADDITLFSSSVTGLQRLVNICVDYARKWRFNFGAQKTQLTTLGKNVLAAKPQISLGNNIVHHQDSIELLGVSTNSYCDYTSHVENRISACRRGLFALSHAGMSYPGLCTKAKVYLWKSIGAPLMFYATECIPLRKSHIKSMYTAQGKIIKNVLGFSKRNHHSVIFDALGISKPEDHISKSTAAFYNRIFRVKTPLLQLQSLALANYISTGLPVKNTIIDKLVQCNISPVKAAFAEVDCIDKNVQSNGVIDSLRYLLHHENFVKPWSVEHSISDLLTRAF